MASLPTSIEPEVVPFTHPDEKWKEEAQIAQAEEDTWIDTEDIIRHFCANKVWPKKSKGEARYFVERRMRWAESVVRLFTIPYSKTGLMFLLRPQESGHELLEWLLIDAYAQKNPAPPKVPFHVSTGDGHREIYYR